MATAPTSGRGHPRPAGAAAAAPSAPCASYWSAWEIAVRWSWRSMTCNGATPTARSCSPRSSIRPTRHGSSCWAVIAATRRTKSPLLRALLQVHEGGGPGVDRRVLALEPLEPAGRRGSGAEPPRQPGPGGCAHAAAIARESGGNPFFITELVRYVQADTGLLRRVPGADEVAFDEVLWARVRRLPEEARRLLEVVAVSGRPLGPGGRVPGRRAGRRRAEGTAPPAIRPADPQHRPGGPWRDRDLPRPRPRGRGRPHPAEHPGRPPPAPRAGARVLGPGRSRGPGRPFPRRRGARAGGDVLRAGGRAGGRGPGVRSRRPAVPPGPRAASGGFERGPATPDEPRGCPGQRRPWRRGGAGVPRRPPSVLRPPKPSSSGDVPPCSSCPAATSTRDSPKLNAVLKAVGMTFPSTPRRALVSLILNRSSSACVGSIIVPAMPARSPRRTLDEDRCLLDGGRRIGPHRHHPQRRFPVAGLLLALKAGEPHRIARALVFEAAHVSAAGGPGERRASELLEAAEEIAQDLNDPHTSGRIILARAMSAYFNGRWKRAVELSDRAVDILRTVPSGGTWERDLTSLLRSGRSSSAGNSRS